MEGLNVEDIGRLIRACDVAISCLQLAGPPRDLLLFQETREKLQRYLVTSTDLSDDLEWRSHAEQDGIGQTR